MKKFAIFFLVLLTSIMFTSCSAIDQLGLTKTIITIHNGDETYEQEIVNLSQRNLIEVPTKEGYYLKGVYDDTEGGTRFFNGIGQTLEPWSRKNSTDLYCQWGVLNDINYVSDEITNGDNGSYVYFTFEGLSADLLAAIQSNPTKTLYVTIYYTVKGSSYFDDEFEFTVYAKANGTEFGEISINVGTEWEERTSTIQITGEAFDDKELKIYFNTNNSSLVANERVHIDKIYVEISY